MEIGKLIHKATFFQRMVSKDHIGQEIVSYQPFFSRWCCIKQLSFKETLAAGSERASRMIKIQMRYSPAVTADMQVVYDNHIYDIVSILDKDMRHIELELLCEERL